MSFFNSSSDRPSSFSTIGVDSSLAQWTSEIRKLQSDLDREAEEETKRLRDEIESSKIMRKKRASTRPRSSGSFGREKLPDIQDAEKAKDSAPHPSTDLIDVVERQRNQTDALKKLVGTEESQSKSTQVNSFASPKPLTSPPTLSGANSSSPRRSIDLPASPLRGVTTSNGIKSTGLITGSPVLSPVVQNGSPKPLGERSTPSPTSRVKEDRTPRGPLPSRTLFSNEDTPRTLLRPTSLQSPLKPSPIIQTQIPSSSRNPFNETNGASPSSSPTKISRRPVSEIPSLARSIQPSPSTPPQHFTFTSNSDLGPAFIRPLVQKDPTPSLTRLQGRGFVAQRIKAGAGFASSSLSSSSSGQLPPESPTSSVKSKKSSVLDRWPAANANNEPATKSSPLPKPLPKKTWPMEQQIAQRTGEANTSTRASVPPGIRPSSPIKLTEKRTSMPSPVMERSLTSEGPGRIPAPPKKKPSTPDLPKPQHPNQYDSGVTAAVEFGAIRLPGFGGTPPPQLVRSRNSDRGKDRERSEPSPIPNEGVESVPGKATLSHPTRDRARKPRRPKASGPSLSRSTPLPSRSMIDSSPVPNSPIVDRSTIIEDVVIAGDSPTTAVQDSAQTEDSRDISISEPVFESALSASSAVDISSPIQHSSPTLTALHSEALPPASSRHSRDQSTEIKNTTSPPRVEETLAYHTLDTSDPWRTHTPEASHSPTSSPSLGSSLILTPTNSAFKRRSLPGLTSAENQAIAPSSPVGTRRSVLEITQDLKDEERYEPEIQSVTTPPATSSWIRPSSSRRASEDGSDIVQKTSERDVEEQPTKIDHRSSGGPLPQQPPYPSPTNHVIPFSAPIPRPRAITNPAIEAAKAERRRSNLEKYSSIILPPLAEEKTPIPTPDGSLIKRETSGSSSNEVDEEGRLISGTSTGSGGHRRTPSAFDLHRAMMDHRALIEMEVPSPPPLDSPATSAAVLPSDKAEPKVETVEEMMHFSFDDSDFSCTIDVESILSSRSPYVPPSDHQTISVEILSVVGNTSTPITTNPHIFHDVEVRAIIHRVKSKASGLVSTRVFGWRGKMAQVGAMEARKLGELALRFGSNLIPCIQGSESEEFVRILGGIMVTRQGPREHWTAENTSMHCVRELRGCIYIEQVELERQNLCSAFSYVASVIDTVYVFHGKGSTDVERGEAYLYAQSISNDPGSIIEFEEGSEDPMFSMSLGDDDYASADFWRFRKSIVDSSTWLYRVDDGDQPKVQWIPEVAAESIDPTAVYIVQASMELYVIVGAEARSLRNDIRYAMHTALAISAFLAPDLSFSPPVHVLILPSQVPIELRVAHFRYLDEEQLNIGEVPDHMNLLSLEEALKQISTTSWPRTVLEDLDFLPLGISPADVHTSSVSH